MEKNTSIKHTEPTKPELYCWESSKNQYYCLTLAGKLSFLTRRQLSGKKNYGIYRSYYDLAMAINRDAGKEIIKLDPYYKREVETEVALD